MIWNLSASHHHIIRCLSITVSIPYDKCHWKNVIATKTQLQYYLATYISNSQEFNVSQLFIFRCLASVLCYLRCPIAGAEDVHGGPPPGDNLCPQPRLANNCNSNHNLLLSLCNSHSYSKGSWCVVEPFGSWFLLKPDIVKLSDLTWLFSSSWLSLSLWLSSSSVATISWGSNFRLLTPATTVLTSDKVHGDNPPPPSPHHPWPVNDPCRSLHRFEYAERSFFERLLRPEDKNVPKFLSSRPAKWFPLFQQEARDNFDVCCSSLEAHLAAVAAASRVRIPASCQILYMKWR